MPIGEHFYRCLDCGKQGTCGDCIRIFCPVCAEKPKTCRKCGRVEPQDRFGFTSVCTLCWLDGNERIRADHAAKREEAISAERDAERDTEAVPSSDPVETGGFRGRGIL